MCNRNRRGKYKTGNLLDWSTASAGEKLWGQRGRNSRINKKSRRDKTKPERLLLDLVMRLRNCHGYYGCYGIKKPLTKGF